MSIRGDARGVTGDTYPQAWSPRSRCWGPVPPTGSVVSRSQVSPCPLLSLLLPCLLPHEDCATLTWRSVTSSQPGQLCSGPILRSWGVQGPGPFEVKNPGGQHSLCGLVGGVGGRGRGSKAGIQKPHGGSSILTQGGQMDRQRQEGGQVGDYPCPLGSEQSLEGQAR